MKRYVYHLLPNPMMGTVLYPLNHLKEINPELAAKALEKYKNREEITKRKIPILNVLWNDVLHFSCLDPQKTFKAVVEIVGLRNVTRKVLKIPIEVFDPKKCVYFNASDDPRESHSVMLDGEVTAFDLAAYKEMSDVTTEQKENWQELARNKEPVLLYGKTTHLLYHGTIDIKGFETEEVSF